ncbi:MAG: LptF/LptG family permease [Nitrospirota bacterium]
MKILHRYILKEHILPFFFAIALFTFIFFLSEIIKSSELIISKQAPPILILKLFFLLIPATFNITIPIALLMATLISWGKLKAEQEITAMWASGISLISSIVWMLIAGVFFSFITLIIGETLLPWTNHTIERIQSTILQQEPSICLEERRFIKIGQRELFIDELDKKKMRLKGIYIYEYGGSFGVPKEAIFAKNAEYIKSYAGIILRLKQGTIHQVDEKDPSKYHILTFESHTISLGGGKNISEQNIPKSIDTMTISELKKEIKKCKVASLNINPLLIELSKHIAMPFGCLAFVFIGLPLGLMVRQKEKSIGFGTSILIVFVYYLLLKLNENLAEKGIIEPVLAIWLPNIIIGSLGIILLIRFLRRT